MTAATCPIFFISLIPRMIGIHSVKDTLTIDDKQW